jgi:hypothetical protein
MSAMVDLGLPCQSFRPFRIRRSRISRNRAPASSCPDRPSRWAASSYTCRIVAAQATLMATGNSTSIRISAAYCAFRRSRTAFRAEAEQDSGPVPNTNRSVATLAF